MQTFLVDLRSARAIVALINMTSSRETAVTKQEFERIKERVKQAQLRESFERAGAFPQILAEKDAELAAVEKLLQEALGEIGRKNEALSKQADRLLARVASKYLPRD